MVSQKNVKAPFFAKSHLFIDIGALPFEVVGIVCTATQRRRDVAPSSR